MGLRKAKVYAAMTCCWGTGMMRQQLSLKHMVQEVYLKLPWS
jgi:hypothetical protein